MQTQLLKDKVIVLTGAAGLLGKVLSKAIVQSGASLVAADVHREAVEALSEDLNKDLPGTVLSMPLDICSKRSLGSCIESSKKQFGKIDALVNTAYPRNNNYGRSFEAVSFEDFSENISLHLGGYFLSSQQFAEFFKEQGSGVIINFASIYGVIAPRFDVYEETAMTMPVEYAAIKAGIIHLTRYIAQYYKKNCVRANCISPGGIFASQDERFLKRYQDYCGAKGMLDAADIVGTLLYLLSDNARYVTGQNIVVDDGFTL